MVNRDALRWNPGLTALTLLAIGWVLITALLVFNSMDFSQAYGGYVGRTAISGWMGLIVMAVAVGLLLVIYSELPAADPVPDRFPPEE